MPEETPIPCAPRNNCATSLLQGANVLAEDEVLACADSVDDWHHFGADLRELRLKIE